MHSTPNFGKLTTQLLIAGLLLSACDRETDSASASDSADLDAELRLIISKRGLTGDPSAGRDLPSINDPLARLGKKLFFTKALGGDLDVACASCHHPLLGGGDGLSLSVGVGAVDPDLLGPGRQHDWQGRGADDPDADGGPNVPRNASTTFNVAMYDRFLFHDGRIESIGELARQAGAGSGIITPDSLFRNADPDAGNNLVEAQARFPVISEDEMLGFGFPQRRRGEELRAHLAGRLGNYGDGRGELARTEWLSEFRSAFKQPAASAESLVTFANINKAMAAYQHSQVFINTPWKRYIEGEADVLTNQQKRGALLFYRTRQEGGAECAECHSGDFFTDESFNVLAMPQIGRGKANGPYRDHDNGRFKVSRRSDDKFAFRTPTLLNITVTAPYSHGGAYQTLIEVVRHHLNPAAAVANYDYSLKKLAQFADTGFGYEHAPENTKRALNKLLDDRAEGRNVIEDVDLRDEEIADVVAFMHSLTDPCVEDSDCLAPWLPGSMETDPDGLRLNTRFITAAVGSE